jgi:hypothetical protein
MKVGLQRAISSTWREPSLVTNIAFRAAETISADRPIAAYAFAGSSTSRSAKLVSRRVTPGRRESSF